MPRLRGKPDVFCAEVNICVFLLVTVCSLNVLSTFIPIKSESILSVCFVFINKKRTKRDGAKYMFIVHTTCNVFKRWQYILKIKISDERTTTDHTDQNTPQPPNPPPPCWAAIAKITAADWTTQRRRYEGVCCSLLVSNNNQWQIMRIKYWAWTPPFLAELLAFN